MAYVRNAGSSEKTRLALTDVKRMIKCRGRYRYSLEHNVGVGVHKRIEMNIFGPWSWLMDVTVLDIFTLDEHERVDKQTETCM